MSEGMAAREPVTELVSVVTSHGDLIHYAPTDNLLSPLCGIRIQTATTVDRQTFLDLTSVRSCRRCEVRRG